MVALRKAYQEVVGQAVEGIEQFWKEYDSYENSLNKITAKKFLNDRTGAYQGARGALRERKVRMEVCYCNHGASFGHMCVYVKFAWRCAIAIMERSVMCVCGTSLTDTIAWGGG